MMAMGWAWVMLRPFVEDKGRGLLRRSAKSTDFIRGFFQFGRVQQKGSLQGFTVFFGQVIAPACEQSFDRLSKGQGVTTARLVCCGNSKLAQGTSEVTTEVHL